MLSGFFFGTFAPYNALGGGWGIERGRANEGDVARLLVDQLTMKMAQNRISEAIQRPLGIERQRQLLGMSDGGTLPSDVMDGIFQWWQKDVMGPAEAIANNPAASCAEAQIASQTLLGMMRQRALLGMSPEPDDKSSGAGEARLSEAALDKSWADITSKLLTRCQEEALDECVMTGRFEQILQTDFGFSRQEQLLGGTGGDGKWVDDALRQCAIYDLHFVSTTKVPQIFNLAMVRDTKIKLEFKPVPGGLMSASTTSKLEDLLKGETSGGSNPFFISVKCSQPPLQVVCMAGATISPFRSRVFSMELKHRQFYVDAAGISKERISGNDKFVFEVADGIYGVDAFVKVPRMPDVPVPMQAIGFSFYTAHKKDRPGTGPGAGVTVKIDRNKRGAYPVIFAFTYADQDSESNFSASDSTEFELIHTPKPDKLPPRGPEPTRKPLKPSPRINRVGD